jgi:diguanylate cyclase
VALLAYALLWPTLAYALIRRSKAPAAALEYRILLGDSVAGGFWIAVMAFDTLPSVLLAVMLTMDKVIVGGQRFALKAFALMLLACLATSAALGFPFEPATSFPVMLACLPLLVVYPMAVGATSHVLAQKTLRQKRMLERISRFDAATGLMNRQQFQYAATVELNRFLRTGRPAVLMMIDIDRFKQINDGHGHTVGDRVIEEFARLMKACLRDMDTGGRYGGDEFGIVMPETLWQEAIVAAERLRRQVVAHDFPGLPQRCTVSIGLAQLNPQIGNVNDWVSAADTALYAAKRRGRDCIEVARWP